MKTNSSNTNPATTANTAPTLDAIRAALTAAGINPDAAEQIIRDRYGITDPEPAADEIGTACRLHITHHSEGGKLAGMLSMGTPVSVNPRCQARRNCAASICAHCYANAEVGYKKTLRNNLTENAEILTAGLLTVAETPIFTGNLPSRFESFGDSINDTHAANYLLTARRQPLHTFAVWSKNPDHYAAALELIGGEWPGNLSFVYSIPTTDPQDAYRIAARMKAKYPFIQYVFVVYTSRDTARAAGHPIDCAHRECRHCLKCYQPRPLDLPPVIVAELLKSQQASETAAAHRTAAAYLETVAPYLSPKDARKVGRAAVRTAAEHIENAAAGIGTDPDPEDITRAALVSLMQRYDTVTWTDDRAALIAAGIPAETLDSARRTATTARTAPRA